MKIDKLNIVFFNRIHKLLGQNHLIFKPAELVSSKQKETMNTLTSPTQYKVLLNAST